MIALILICLAVVLYSLARDKKRANREHFKQFDRDNDLNKTQKR